MEKNEKGKTRVYVINKGGHDFTPAYEYGEIVYLSEGIVDPFSTSNMFRKFESILKSSSPDDFILLTGLTNMSVIATSIFTYIHGRLNLLLYKTDKYVVRKIDFKDLIDLQDILAGNHEVTGE